MASRKRSKHPQGPVQQFSRRLVALHTLLDSDPAAVGDQALKLLEEYLESLAHGYGYRGEGSLGRYAMFLRGRDGLPADMLDRLDSYTQVRNCLAHTYGLQASPALAAELLDFAERLLKQEATTAAELMTRDVQTVGAADRLPGVRDLMLSHGYGRLPVLHDGKIVGLLIERDVVAAQVLAEQSKRPLAALTVADALPDDAAERIVMVSPGTTREAVTDLLRRAGIVACLVTPSGSADQAPVGIITPADLLYRL
ncbi:MAG: CBS domain-containing protein [Kouleothrix sp.]|nr:CBS domain-containing protein [Kouleothrix sp.]